MKYRVMITEFVMGEVTVDANNRDDAVANAVIKFKKGGTELKSSGTKYEVVTESA